MSTDDDTRTDGERRAFIKGAAVTAAAGGLFATGCGSKPEGGGAPSVSTRKKIKWKMCTTWGPGFPVMGEGAQMLAQWIGEMSQGDLEVKVFGAGELVGALEVFDAVSQGTAQMGHSAAYYWAGKIKAAQFFAAVPFGMNAQQMNAWLYGGGGLELFRPAIPACRWAAGSARRSSRSPTSTVWSCAFPGSAALCSSAPVERPG
jgi:TRAP-type mannitol/chloroaromatic compound transport system substrate-binding protein